MSEFCLSEVNPHSGISFSTKETCGWNEVCGILEGIIIKLPTFWNRLCVGITPYDALTCCLWSQLTRFWNRASVCFFLSSHLSFSRKQDWLPVADIRTLHLKHCRLLIIDRVLLESGRLQGSPVLMAETADSLWSFRSFIQAFILYIYVVCV